MTDNQGLKKRKFPGKLIEISLGHKLKTTVLSWHHKKNIFLKTSKLDYHFVHIDQLASIHVQCVNSCITAVHHDHAIARYGKTTYWWSAKAV